VYPLSSLLELILWFNRHEASNQVWMETYLSACVRAILFADDGNYRIAGYRKLDPIPNVAAEAKFLDATQNMFDKGRLVHIIAQCEIID
jgi:hypothetical protein